MSITGSVILLIGRILFVALFLSSARGHIINHDRYVTTATGKIPFPYVAGWPVGTWLIVGVLSLVLGVWPDIGALMMASFLIPTAVLFHNFWTLSDPAQRRTQQGAFFRNVSLLGATLACFVLFSVAGPGQFAITQALYSTCADFALARRPFGTDLGSLLKDSPGV